MPSRTWTSGAERGQSLHESLIGADHASFRRRELCASTDFLVGGDPVSSADVFRWSIFLPQPIRRIFRVRRCGSVLEAYRLDLTL